MKKIIIIAVSVLVGLSVLAGGFWLTKSYFDKQCADIQSELDAYKETYDGVELVAAYTVTEDKSYGEIISDEDLVEITEIYSDNLILDPAEIIGKYYRINVSAGTPLTSDVIMDFEVADDERAYDVITSYKAIGLKPNDFVDIRFVTPMGEDYIALSHKRVEGVYGDVLKLAMSEYDIMIYNSLQVDKILLKGSTIYASKYIEPGGQSAAQTFYPFSSEVLSTMSRDPNIDKELDYFTLGKQRAELLRRYQTYSEDEIVSSLLQSGKDALTSIIQSGQTQFDTQEEIAKQEALEQAILEQQQ